jgi:4-hydroxybenzoyl-CoA thioesterase
MTADPQETVMHSFRYERRVHWSDCDPAGIVFFAQYGRWMSDGLLEMLLALGIDPAAPADSGKGRGAPSGSMPSVGFSLRFLAPARLHERVIHEVQVKKLGGASLEFGHRIFSREGVLLVEGEEKRVWVQMNPTDGSMKSTPIPDTVRALLARSAPDLNATGQSGVAS